MKQSIHLRAAVCSSLIFAAVLGVFAPPAAAFEPDDEPPWLMSLGPVELEPQHEWWADGAARGSLWLSVQATFVRTDEGKNDFAAIALLGVPLERVHRARDRSLIVAERPAPAVVDVPPAEALAQPEVPPDKLPAFVVTPQMARAAIAAALEHAGLDAATGRVDRLATRSRTSSLLPELRLRVTRQLDDSQVLSPTEYDPDRVTATVKASWWFEARATFRLDKLVFADEEVALERMREERIEAGKKLRERVLATLFAWQKAMRLRDDPSAEPEARTKAEWEVIEAEVTLDVLTGGWFGRWKKTRPRAAPNG
jgi:hypothetical protein